MKIKILILLSLLLICGCFFMACDNVQEPEQSKPSVETKEEYVKRIKSEVLYDLPAYIKTINTKVIEVKLHTFIDLSEDISFTNGTEFEIYGERYILDENINKSCLASNRTPFKPASEREVVMRCLDTNNNIYTLVVL